MATRLLNETHNPTEVLDVLDALAKDDKAFYDPQTQIRKVPIFDYDATTGEPYRIQRWQERRVIPNDGHLRRSQLLERCAIEGKDTYIDGIGWVRGGRKRERDVDQPTIFSR